MTPTELLHLRLVNQHLAQPDFKTPYEVVKWHGAMQSQDYYGGLWSIGLRMKHATASLVEQAFNEGTIIRTWPMRGTWHFVAPEDVRWVLKLFRHRYATQYGTYLRKLALTEKLLAKTQAILHQALQDKQFKTRDEINDILEQHGIDTSTMRLTFIIQRAATDGLIINGPRRGKQFTFALLEEWVTQHEQLEGEAALAHWTKRYFMSHGPATEYDFAWWSGLTVTEARHGIALVEKELETIEVNNKTYYHRGLPTRDVIEQHHALLLQAFDEYFIAYKNKSEHILDASIAAKASQALSGMLGQPIIIDRQVVGFWRKTASARRVEVEKRLFVKLTKEQQQALVEAEKRYKAFL